MYSELPLLIRWLYYLYSATFFCSSHLYVRSNTYSFWKKTSVTIIIASQVLPLRLVCRVQETEPERSGVRKANVQRYFRIPGGCAFDSSSIQCSSVHDYSCSTEQHYLRNTCLWMAKSLVINPPLSSLTHTIKSQSNSLQRNLLNHQWGPSLSEAAIYLASFRLCK